MSGTPLTGHPQSSTIRPTAATLTSACDPKIRALELQAKLDEEFAQLSEDRYVLRSWIFPRTDPSAQRYHPVNLQRIVQNAMQIFHIDRKTSSPRTSSTRYASYAAD